MFYTFAPWSICTDENNKPRNEHKTNNSQWWWCKLKTPRYKTHHENILFQEALQMLPIFSLLESPIKPIESRNTKHIRRSQKFEYSFPSPPQKSKSHQTTSHLHKHVLPNTNVLKIPNELHHSLDQRHLIMVLNYLFKRNMS